MATGKLFGTDTAGSIDNASQYIVMTRWQAQASGIVSQVRLYSRISGNVKVGIYADSSGEPGSLLASQQTSTAVTGGQWNTVNLSSNLSVIKDTYYWVAFNSSADGANVAVSATGQSRRYKSFAFSNDLPNPAGTGYTSESNQYYDSTAAYGILTILPSAIASAEAFGTPKLTLKIAPSGIASLEAFGSPTVTKGGSGQTIFPSGIPSAEAFGIPTVSKAGVQIIAPVGIPSAEAFGLPTVSRWAVHVILEAEYFEESPQVNRAFVVGADLSGGQVSGSALTSSEASLIGERLEVEHNPAVVSASVAAGVATARLEKARLDGRQAGVTIPPHCGLELWDVLNIVDDVCSQSRDYRVSGYVFEYEAKGTVCRHRLTLCAV